MNSITYPLVENPFKKKDILEAIKVLKSGQITMSKKTFEFEKKFAKFIGAKYALMVNSGSSANLLAAFAIINPKKKNHVKKNFEFLIPSLCWSTSLWPFIQAGLKPRFVDVDKKNFNIDLNDLKKKINKNTKVIMCVHTLGGSTNIEELKKIAQSKKIFLIEDTCESLGAKYKNKFLGTYGDFGTYSFYVSHQITSGEGGMIVCNSKTDYDLLHSLRSHGWSRNYSSNLNKDRSFNFINSGFNLRPLDITASIGINQFKRLKYLIKIRTQNRNKIILSLKKSKKWKNQFSFLEFDKNVSPSYFGFSLIINKRYLKKKQKFLDFLNKKKIETRKIISGNFLNQPSIKLYNLNKKNLKFKNAQFIDDSGFFIGLHSSPISNAKLKYLVKNLLDISNI